MFNRNCSFRLVNWSDPTYVRTYVHASGERTKWEFRAVADRLSSCLQRRRPPPLSLESRRRPDREWRLAWQLLFAGIYRLHKCLWQKKKAFCVPYRSIAAVAKQRRQKCGVQWPTGRGGASEKLQSDAGDWTGLPNHSIHYCFCTRFFAFSFVQYREIASWRQCSASIWQT
jgi:hypothetical protein